MINWIFSFFSSQKEILSFDVSAKERYAKEARSNPKLTHLKIQLKRNSTGMGNVYIGFGEGKSDPIWMSGIPLEISETDLNVLKQGEISYSPEEGSFLYFPNVDLDWEETPNPNIKRIRANKSFTNGKSVWTSEDRETTVLPIRKILEMENIVSLYAKGKILQIELVHSEMLEKEKDEISEWILNYFSGLYPQLEVKSQNHQ